MFVTTTRLLAGICTLGAMACAAGAQQTPATGSDGTAPRVSITAGMPEATYTTDKGQFTVSRDQTPGAKLTDDWALIGRDCPPFCIQPMQPAPGVTTIGELELIDAMKAGDTILVDGRTPDWYEGGTIPGAINIPYTQSIERLAELNCEPDFDGKFDCADASKVIMFCNGPWCGQSPTAIREMIGAGFPVDRIRYYRGGMQEWRLLGLTVRGGAQSAPTDPIAAKDVTPAEAVTPGAGQQSAAQDNLPQNAGQTVNDGVTTPVDNPVVVERTERAAQTPLAPEEGQATDARPEDGEKPASDAVRDNAAASGMETGTETAPAAQPSN